MTIIASADGSALGNPGPAGWAWYIDPTSWQAGGWAHGTAGTSPCACCATASM